MGTAWERGRLLSVLKLMFSMPVLSFSLASRTPVISRGAISTSEQVAKLQVVPSTSMELSRVLRGMVRHSFRPRRGVKAMIVAEGTGRR